MGAPRVRAEIGDRPPQRLARANNPDVFTLHSSHPALSRLFGALFISACAGIGQPRYPDCAGNIQITKRQPSKSRLLYFCNPRNRDGVTTGRYRLRARRSAFIGKARFRPSESTPIRGSGFHQIVCDPVSRYSEMKG